MSNASTGSKIYICATPSPVATTKEQYEALTWLEITDTESIAPYGDKASSITFTALSDSRVRKSKGPYDAGDFDVVFAVKADDAGQAAVLTAVASRFNFAVKITIPDAPSAGYTDTTEYFAAKVMGAPLNIGSATDTTKRTATFAIDTEIVTDASHATGS